MKELQIAGWVWFIFFLFIAVISFVDAVTISTNESKTLVHFPYHVWKVGQAIWWLLLSFSGLVAFMLSSIIAGLSSTGIKQVGKEKLSDVKKIKKISLVHHLKQSETSEIKIADTVVYRNKGITILQKLGFSREIAKQIYYNTPIIIRVPKVKVKEICEKLKEGFAIDVVPSTLISGTLFCPYCGVKNAQGVEVCPNCKTSLTSIFEASEYECETCGSDVPEDAKYCPKCGTRLND